jgi:hypothetical protein
MSIDHTIAEIRAALATVSALHAAGNLSRADIRAAVEFVEGCCDEIASLAAPAATPFGTTALPVLTLAGIAAQARAEARQAAGRRHLQLVSSQGDAA